jgi:plasmid replication initiation protein
LKQNGLNNRKVVKQSIELTHAQSPLSRAEIDLILTLIAQINQEDKHLKSFNFSVKELEAYMGRKLNSKQLQDLVLNLLKKPLLLPVDGTLDSEHWRAANWFSYFDYEEGMISCAFSEKLKPFLLEIKGRYSIGSLKALLPMRSKYSKELYMILATERYRGYYQVELAKLMQKLQVPKSLLVYKNFKAKVLIQAQKDLDKYSDIVFTFDEIKKIGKKVVEIKFNITRNLNDLKAFIETIRELYVNVPLLEIKEGTLQCSKKGYLYFKENPDKDIHPKTAEKLWQHLHEKRSELIIFKINEEEQQKHIQKTLF